MMSRPSTYSRLEAAGTAGRMPALQGWSVRRLRAKSQVLAFVEHDADLLQRAVAAVVPQQPSLAVEDRVRACLETTRGAVFGEKAGWRDEGEYPWWIFD